MNITVVVPAYNEQENLPRLLDELEKFVLDAPCAVEVIAVDDGSTDDTGDLLWRESSRRPWLRVIAGHENRGMGHALKLGSGKNLPYVLWRAFPAGCSCRAPTCRSSRGAVRPSHHPSGA